MDPTGWSHESVAGLADAVTAAADLRDAARQVCALVARAAAAERVCIIARGTPQQFVAVGASDEPGELLVSWQAARREGPSVDAARHGQPVLVPQLDDRSGRRWPGYTPRAVAAGVRALWSVPLVAGDRCAGAIEGHRARAGPVDLATVRDVGGVGTLVGVLLLASQEREQAARQADTLQAALRQRVLVEQAKGRLAERHHIHVEGALALLSGHARTHGLDLHEVAAQVVAGRLRL